MNRSPWLKPKVRSVLLELQIGFGKASNRNPWNEHRAPLVGPVAIVRFCLDVLPVWLLRGNNDNAMLMSRRGMLLPCENPEPKPHTKD